MKISVLMSVYEKEKPSNLKESLESIINQTLPPDEIILMKDGNLTEELEEVIQSFSKVDILKVYEVKEGKGLGNALREGVLHCSYPYIARMDSDDIALLDRLEKQVAYLEKNPKIDVLGGYIEEYDNNLRNIISIRTVPLKEEEIKEKMKKENPFNHGTVIFKKEKCIEAGNYDNIKIEDYDLWARMSLKKARMENLNQVFLKSRTGKEFYKRRTGRKYKEAIKVLENRLLSYKIITKKEYRVNYFKRWILASIPPVWKEWIYARIIRKISLEEEKKYILGKIEEGDAKGIEAYLYDIKTQTVIERIIECIWVIIMIIIFFPIMLIIGLIIKMDSPGKVLYCQQRLGKDRKVFTIFKFRSMIEDAEKETGPVLEEKQQKKITRIGKILRNHKLDELPQLFNVLLGQMSIIGPRPERPELEEEIRNQIPEFQWRILVKPGISSLASLQKTENIEKLAYDIVMMKRRNIILDLRILGKTIHKVILGKK